MDQSSTPKGTTAVVFVCERCLQPLKLHSQLTEQALSNALTNEKVKDDSSPLSGSINSDDIDSNTPPKELPVAKYYRKLARDGSEDSKLPQSAQGAKQLFDIHSSVSDVDHPLCEECTDGLLDELDVQLRNAEEESRVCSEFLRQFQSEEQDHGGGSGGEQEEIISLEEAQRQIEKLKAEENELIQHLKKIEEDRATIKMSIQTQEEEAKKLDEQESRHWKAVHDHERRVNEYYEEHHGIEQQYQQAVEQLDRLKKTNVFNDAFHIWHDGHFGTINTFRLGRLPTVPVEWNEINAAWGQTVLLLHTMAKKMNFKFSGYRLIPFGSHSRLEKIDDTANQLPLYHTGGFKWSLWDSSKFDLAMVAFLECLQQFKDFVESQDKHFKLPYRINKDKIGDSNGELSIKTQHNHEETWTKALKFMLTNLKWSLAWVCKQPG